MDGSGNGKSASDTRGAQRAGKRFSAEYQPPKAPKSPASDADAIRAAVVRAGKRGNMSAVQVYLAYYAGLAARDSGPTLSERVQALLADRERRERELALDDQYLVEPTE